MHYPLKKFLTVEAASGLLLIAAAIAAMILKNSTFSDVYNGFLYSNVEVRAESFSINKPVLLWVNDGIMAIFFFVIGLELKKEMLVGKLSNPKAIVLPGIASIGGIGVPAMIYLYINWGNELSAHGWAIPTATDIAFALGVLSLLGDRVPASLKLFLMTLAIFDDVAGIVVIAIFYTDHIAVELLIGAVFCYGGMVVLNHLNVVRIAPYLLLGIVIWVLFLKSGVHATVAGVLNALFIPLTVPDHDSDHSPLNQLLHDLHPYVALGVLPLFAFANAGIDISSTQLHNLSSDIPLGIILGLFIGKQLGVFSFSWIAIKLKVAQLPEGANWIQLYGTSVLCGIGFTMSLFIASLAFSHGGAGEARVDRLAIVLASTLSAILGFLILKFSSTSKN